MWSGNGDGAGLRLRDDGADRDAVRSDRDRPGVVHLIILWWAVSAPLVVLLLFVDVTVELSPFVVGGEEVEPSTEIDVLPVVGGHVVGGAGAGAVLSILWSRVANTWTAAAAGFVAAIPFFLAIRIAVLGPLGWTLEGVLGLGMRALLGVALGLILWRWERAR
jgi:hypothetical protein